MNLRFRAPVCANYTFIIFRIGKSEKIFNGPPVVSIFLAAEYHFRSDPCVIPDNSAQAECQLRALSMFGMMLRRDLPLWQLDGRKRITIS